jgi:hypothetical protein
MTGLNLTDLKFRVIEPALLVVGLSSTAAINLVAGTALVESACQYLVQQGGGPAKGLWQVEEATEQDMWKSYLAYHASLASLVRSLLAPGETTPQLVWNLAYGAVTCRIKYYRSPLALPAYNDAAGMAALHKQVYNTALGAADPTTNTPLFQQAIAA